MILLLPFIKTYLFSQCLFICSGILITFSSAHFFVNIWSALLCLFVLILLLLLLLLFTNKEFFYILTVENDYKKWSTRTVFSVYFSMYYYLHYYYYD